MKLSRLNIPVLACLLLFALPVLAIAAKGGSKGKPQDPGIFKLSLVMTRTAGEDWIGTFQSQGAFSDTGTASMPGGAEGCWPFQQIYLVGAAGSATLGLQVECVGLLKGGKGYGMSDLLFGVYGFDATTGSYTVLDWVTGSADGMLYSGRKNDPSAGRIEWTLTGTLDS